MSLYLIYDSYLFALCMSHEIIMSLFVYAVVWRKNKTISIRQLLSCDVWLVCQFLLFHCNFFSQIHEPSIAALYFFFIKCSKPSSITLEVESCSFELKFNLFFTGQVTEWEVAGLIIGQPPEIPEYKTDVKFTFQYAISVYCIPLGIIIPLFYLSFSFLLGYPGAYVC